MPAPMPRIQVSVWEWIQTALVAVDLAWTTLCLGGYLPGTMVITCGLTGAALSVHLLSRAFAGNATTVGVHPAGWLLLPFLAYAAGNVLWVTPVHWLGWRDWFWWAEMVAIYWVVLNGVRSPGPRRALFATLVALGAVAVLMGCYQRFERPDWMMLGRIQSGPFIGRSSGSFGIPNSFAAFLILLLPAIGALAFRRGAGAMWRIFCGGLALVFTFGLVLTISRGAWLGLALALAVWPLIACRGNWGRRVGIASAVVAGLLSAGGVLYANSPKVHERLVYLARDMGEKTRPIMWRAAWRLFREHPAVGTGGGSYNVLFEKHRPEQFSDEPKWAHNEYLNTLSDYGVVGFGLFFGACGAIGWRCRRRFNRDRAEPVGEMGVEERDWIDAPLLTQALGIGMLAFGLQLFVDFHFKIPALGMAFAVVAALVIGRLWQMKRKTVDQAGPLKRGALVVAALGAVTIAGLFVTAFCAEELRFDARESIDLLAAKPAEKERFRAKVSDAAADLAHAVALDPSNGQAWSDLSYATALRSRSEQGRNTELGREAEIAAERALATSRVFAEFWVRRGVARDMQGRWLDGGNDFTQAIAVAPANSIMWYYYADHLSRKPTSRGLMEAALAFCLRLDPGNPEGLALRQRLAISPKGP